jgi:S-adenosyl-L-methionine hydrolase (adenosine-forming)
MLPTVITLTTDFGWTELPSAMRGVIRHIAPPGTEVVDINHGVPPQNIIQGAYAMLTVCPIFKGAVHIGVVDPGVGTKRRAIAVETNDGYVVGPDNGLLSPLAHRLGIKRIVALSNGKYWRPPISATFHGRDIFAPVAAHLAAGVAFDALGTETDDMVNLPAFEARDDGSAIHGFVINIDPFGNLVTSIHARMAIDLLEAGKSIDARIGGRRARMHPVSAYGEIEGKSFGVLANSSDFLEIAVHSGSAVERLGVQTGDPVELRK